jgi:hypothetical protein
MTAGCRLEAATAASPERAQEVASAEDPRGRGLSAGLRAGHVEWLGPGDVDPLCLGCLEAHLFSRIQPAREGRPDARGLRDRLDECLDAVEP